MDFLTDLKAAILTHWRTSIAGLAAAIFAVMSSYGVGVSQSRSAAIIAAILAWIGFNASDSEPEDKFNA